MTFSQYDEYDLWFDGSVEAHPDELPDLIMRLLDPESIRKIHIPDSALNHPEVKLFNRYGDVTLKSKKKLGKINTEWNLPAKYRDMDIIAHIKNLPIPNVSPVTMKYAEKRRDDELTEFERRGLLNLLRCVVYVVDRLTAEDIPFGPRGSSCSSYVLFLMGLHTVDSFNFQIPITDFFKKTDDDSV